MKKKNLSVLLLSLIGAIYLFISLIAGLITNFSDAFLTGLGFFTFSAVIAFSLALIFGNSKTSIQDVFFNAPIYYVGAAYFAISGLVSVLHMLSGLFSLKGLTIVQLIIFAAFTVYFILSLATKMNAGNAAVQVAEKNVFIRDMHNKVDSMAACCSDRDTKIKLEKLAEAFQYSKPATNQTLYESEDNIRQQIAILGYQLDTKDLTAAQETISAINIALTKRNELAASIR